jgi:hypothetical protein
MYFDNTHTLQENIDIFIEQNPQYADLKDKISEDAFSLVDDFHYDPVDVFNAVSSFFIDVESNDDEDETLKRARELNSSAPKFRVLKQAIIDYI